MKQPHGRARASGEAGFALVEVLISGVIAVIAATGVFALMQTSVHTASVQRDRSQAYGLAQEDQARLRSMRIATLKVLKEKGEESREVTIDGLKYTIVSKAAFVTSSTGASSCGSSADYIKTFSEVTWANMGVTAPTTIRSIIAPPGGSLAPKSGALSIQVIDSAGKGVSGVGISGTGAGTISGSTDTEGCALFTETPEGNYSITASGTNLVDKDGEVPKAQTVTVNPEATTSLVLQYDRFGWVPFKFQTTGYTGTLVAQKVEKLIAYNTGMSTAKVFKTATAPGLATFTAEPLFPFSSTDAFYAGACTTNNPTSGSAIANVLVPAGAGAAEQTLVLPALRITVKKMETVKEAGVEKEVEKTFEGATVKVVDKECEVSGSKVTRTFTTNSSGQLAEPGLPWSTYEVCVSGSVTTGLKPNKVTAIRHESSKTAEGSTSIVVHNATTDVTTKITGTSPEGACP